jgi:hypothetical protein
MATTLADAIRIHTDSLHFLTPAMEVIVGKPIASRGEVLHAITTYARKNDLYKDPYTIRPDLLLSALLAGPKPIHIKDLNARAARHLTLVDY